VAIRVPESNPAFDDLPDELDAEPSQWVVAQTFWVVMEDGSLREGLSGDEYDRLVDAGRTLDSGVEA
jgi:hypothetical protein